MTRAWAATLTGRAITMAAPERREIDPLQDMPEALARITRFNGSVPGGVYTVAQHCAVMSDVILDEGYDADTAVLALLHDGHEFIWGDITTPQADGLEEIESEMFGDSRVKSIIAEAKRRADAAIFAACGVPWPPTPQQMRTVKLFDIRMLATERRQLLSPSVKRWAAVVERAEPLRIRGRMTIWSTAKAADEYRERLVRLCPAVARRANAA